MGNWFAEKGSISLTLDNGGPRRAARGVQMGLKPLLLARPATHALKLIEQGESSGHVAKSLKVSRHTRCRALFLSGATHDLTLAARFPSGGCDAKNDRVS